MAAYCGVNTIVLIGGEPLLHPSLCEIIECAHERDMRIVIVSNGLALHNQTLARKLLEHLSEADELGISIKGFNEQQYSTSCSVDGGFKKLEEAISNIEDMGISYTLSYVVSESDVETLAIGITSINERFHGPISLSFCSPCFSGGEIENRITPELEAGLNSHVLSLLSNCKARDISVHLNAPLCLVNHTGIDASCDSVSLVTGCHVLNQSGIVFDTKGDLLLCNHLASLPIGLIDADYSSPSEFVSFLSSHKATQAWELFTRLPYERCDNCEELLVCRGGCPLLFY